jgi:hypothetical protein
LIRKFVAELSTLAPMTENNNDPVMPVSTSNATASMTKAASDYRMNFSNGA